MCQLPGTRSWRRPRLASRSPWSNLGSVHFYERCSCEWRPENHRCKLGPMVGHARRRPQFGNRHICNGEDPRCCPFELGNRDYYSQRRQGRASLRGGKSVHPPGRKPDCRYHELVLLAERCVTRRREGTRCAHLQMCPPADKTPV